MPKFTLPTAAFGKKVHRDDQIERVAKDREILIDLWVVVRQTVAPVVVKMPVDAFDTFEPTPLFVLRLDSGQGNVAGLVLVEFVIALAKPVAQQANHTRPSTFGDVGVEDRLLGIVLTHNGFGE